MSIDDEEKTKDTDSNEQEQEQEQSKEEKPSRFLHRRPRMRKQNNNEPQTEQENDHLASAVNEMKKMFKSLVGAEKLDLGSEHEESPKFTEPLFVVPVRDIVIFNFMVIPIFITRPSSIQAIDKAMQGDRHLLILTQKNEVDDPQADDLYQTGTIVQILRVVPVQEGRLKLLVQGACRARVSSFVSTTPYMQANVEVIQNQEVKELSPEVEALVRVTQEELSRFLSNRNITAPDLVQLMHHTNTPGSLADLVCSTLHLPTKEALSVLETSDDIERLQKVYPLLSRQLQVMNEQNRLRDEAKDSLEKAQKEYFLREQIRVIQKELGDSASELEDLKKALKKADLPKEAKEEATKQLRRLSGMHSESPESNIIRTYLELMSELPWKKFSKGNINIKKAQEVLDENHYGLEKIKDRILEYLSVYKLNPNTKGSILCFVGPPGVGKTSLGQSIAKSIGRKFERLSLGGLHDEAEIRGHRRTYIGAMPGRILQLLRHAGTRNPVVILDEIDKVGTDFRGDPQSALLEVLDPEQNSTFSDHYLNLPFDLSKVMFLCTANQLDTIPAALRDRMEIISLSGYTMQEKLEIAVRHLIAKRIEDNGIKKEDLVFADGTLKEIITSYTREAGVRELERKIGAICRKIARKKAEGEEGPFTVTLENLHDYLGPKIFLEEEHQEKLLPGMAYGLAWTQAGGEVLTIEANLMKGKGNVQLTGSLGDVMKESAQTAKSYVRSQAENFGISPEAFENDLHIHVPDGATPKDGPSAGVTLTTALISALKNTAVRNDLCMTGEIDLKGRVLPVGGIKEKLLGAVARGLSHAIIPWQNQKDLDDIPEELRATLTIHPVRFYTEVYALAFNEA